MLSISPFMPTLLAAEVNTIVQNRDGTKHAQLAAQEAMLRLAERDFGITAKRLHHETGIPLSTVQSWRRSTAPAMMSLGDFVLVCRVIPDHLTSLCLEAADKHVGTNETDDGDLDSLGREGAHFLAEHADAKADGVVTHIERAALKDRARRIAGVARKAAA